VDVVEAEVYYHDGCRTPDDGNSVSGMNPPRDTVHRRTTSQGWTAATLTEPSMESMIPVSSML
jgi:hypothetical protein